VSFLTGLGETNIFRANLLLPGATIVLATPVYYLIFLFLLHLVGRPVPWGPDLVRVMAVAALLNMVAMPLVYGLLRWLHRRTSQAEMRI